MFEKTGSKKRPKLLLAAAAQNDLVSIPFLNVISQ
jgi:hypothetical protein